MKFELLVSLRYLLAKRRQTFISLVTFISIAGVAVGVTALIVVLAVMNGFQNELRERILGITSHVVVTSLRGSIDDYPNLIAHIEAEPDVVAATPYIYAQVMVTSQRGLAGAVVRGLNPNTAGQVINVARNLKDGKLADLAPAADDPAAAHPGIVLGSELAKNLGVRLQEFVSVLSPTARLTPMGRSPKTQVFRVVGIFESGMYEFDNTLAYVALSVAQHFLGLGDVVSGIEVKVKDIYQADRLSESLQVKLGHPFWVRDWMQMNRNLFAALKLEKAAMFVILTLIVLVAAFNIISSLIMLVMEKTRDIAILKDYGSHRRKHPLDFRSTGAGHWGAWHYPWVGGGLWVVWTAAGIQVHQIEARRLQHPNTSSEDGNPGCSSHRLGGRGHLFAGHHLSILAGSEAGSRGSAAL